MLKALIMDFDGTIIEPFFDWPAIKAELGIGDVLVLDAVRDADEKEGRRIMAIMEGYEKASAKQSKLNAGAAGFLDFLEEENIPWAIVSNNHSKNIRECCKKFGIKAPHVFGRDCGFYKPSPESLLIAAKALGAEPAECVVVGDNRIDVQGAGNAGMRSILFGENSDENADFFAADFSRVREIVMKLTR